MVTLISRDKSSRLQMFFKIEVLKNFTNFTGKHLRWSLLLIFYWKETPIHRAPLSSASISKFLFIRFSLKCFRRVRSPVLWRYNILRTNKVWNWFFCVWVICSNSPVLKVRLPLWNLTSFSPVSFINLIFCVFCR